MIAAGLWIGEPARRAARFDAAITHGGAHGAVRTTASRPHDDGMDDGTDDGTTTT
jgi:hypothetical protein